MRILVVGAGAIGGYFGGRLLEAGRDVTFMVRPRRAVQLADTGLVIRSPAGDFHCARPPTVAAQDLREPFDLVLLSCKAYDLDDAVRSCARAVGPATAILPLLNGMRHLDVLEQRFGEAAILGGLCNISVALDERGTINHLNDSHLLVYGERAREAELELGPRLLSSGLPADRSFLRRELLRLRRLEGRRTDLLAAREALEELFPGER